jgi:hypothetical protein
MTRFWVCWLQFVCAAVGAWGWDTAPHRTITKAALDSLPAALTAKLGVERANLIETYCILPDRYIEMEQHGFRRAGPGPKTAEELRPYCVRPDGRMVHSATFDREEDLDSLIFLTERILTALSEKRTRDAAMFAGVLAHFIEDSMSPPHSVLAEDLQELGPGLPNLHRALEHSVPEFSIAKRDKAAAGGTLLQGLQSVLDRVYRGAERNRKALPAMVRAVRANEVTEVERYRLEAAREAAEILADGLMLLFSVR